MPFPAKELTRHIEAGYPVLYLVSWEEERVEKKLRELCKDAGETLGFYSWSSTDGFIGKEGKVPNTSDVLTALDWVTQDGRDGLYLFKDLHHYLKDHRTVRKIKNLCRSLAGSKKTLFVLSPTLKALPEDLEREVFVIDVGLPDADEAMGVLEAVLDSHSNSQSLRDSMTPDLRQRCISSLLGLGLTEMELALRRSLVGKSRMDEGVINDIFEEKSQIVRKSGSLEVFKTALNLDDIGGLENLKEWLRIRALAFTDKAAEAGLDKPKGVLIMGVSGCGKSLCAKAIATAWNMPLLRLDLNQVYSGAGGSPEEAFRKAIKTVEAVSPCILWIDEIEAGITRSGEKTGDSPASRIFGYFLTWMQEKSHTVFISATANQIDLLPPELLRKGRFDEIFYVSLPNQRERREILEIHLRKRGFDPERFSLDSLAKNSEGLSGAELEQAVVSAIYESLAKNKELDDRELIIAISSIVPLATTMREEISKLERWASNRAVKASRGG
jgi:SpoVK/Ycf46/Vps4 family AAA+-type ATPase